MFRRNQEGSPSPWNVIDPSLLHIAYIAGQETPPLPPCRHCNETDHNSNGCAMAPLAVPTKVIPYSQQKGNFPCRKEGGLLLIKPALPGSACHGIGENVLSRVLVSSVTHVQCAKGDTKQRTAPTIPPTHHFGHPFVATLARLNQEWPTVHDARSARKLFRTMTETLTCPVFGS